MEDWKAMFEAQKKARKSKKRKHPRTATPWDAYSSVPGARMAMPYWPLSTITGPLGYTPQGSAIADGLVAAQQSGVIGAHAGDFGGADAGGGMGDGGGGCGGEAIDSVKAAIVEAERTCPNKDVVDEMKSLFGRLQVNPESYQCPVYFGTDGVDACATADSVGSLAAACEATLSAFKKATGMEYEDFRRQNSENPSF